MGLQRGASAPPTGGGGDWMRPVRWPAGALRGGLSLLRRLGQAAAQGGGAFAVLRRDGVAAVLRSEDGRLRDCAQRLGGHHAGPAGHLLQRPLGGPHRRRPHHGGRLPRQRPRGNLPALQPSQLQLLHRCWPLRSLGGLLILPSAAQQAEGVHGPLRTLLHPPNPPTAQLVAAAPLPTSSCCLYSVWPGARPGGGRGAPLLSNLFSVGVGVSDFSWWG